MIRKERKKEQASEEALTLDPSIKASDLEKRNTEDKADKKSAGIRRVLKLLRTKRP